MHLCCPVPPQVDEDEPLFLSLINDLFPGLQLDSSTYAELQAAVENQVNLEGLINHPPWNLKLVQVRACDTCTELPDGHKSQNGIKGLDGHPSLQEGPSGLALV